MAKYTALTVNKITDYYKILKDPKKIDGLIEEFFKNQNSSNRSNYDLENI